LAYAWQPEDAGILYAENSDDGSASFYDRDGGVAYKYANAVATALGGGWFGINFYDSQGAYSSYALWKNGKTYCEPETQIWRRINDDRFLVYGGGFAQIIDSAGAVLYDTRDHGSGLIWDTSVTPDGVVRIDTCTTWPEVYSMLVSPDGETLLPAEFLNLTRWGEVYTARRGYYGGLIDGNGNWIIKVSLLDSIDD
jgi:hypothetical protein